MPCTALHKALYVHPFIWVSWCLNKERKYNSHFNMKKGTFTDMMTQSHKAFFNRDQSSCFQKVTFIGLVMFYYKKLYTCFHCRKFKRIRKTKKIIKSHPLNITTEMLKTYLFSHFSMAWYQMYCFVICSCLLTYYEHVSNHIHLVNFSWLNCMCH